MLGLWGALKSEYPRVASILLTLALACGLIYSLAVTADRVVVPRHRTAVVIGPALMTSYRSLIANYGVDIVRADGRRETVQSDTLYDHHAKAGKQTAEASGWFDRIVSVTINGRKIEVGQALSYDLLVTLILANIVVIRVLRFLGARPGRRREREPR